MKRSKEIIINRRIMHRYQQQYRLWKPIIMCMPILRINTDIVEKNDKKEWARLCRQNLIFVDTDKPQEKQPRIVCGPNFQEALKKCLTNKITQQ